MLIDWVTVLAQIVNFLVLVALLKHFLFGRLVAAIDSREKGIAARLAEAAQKSCEAEQCVENAKLQAEKQERERDQMLSDARLDAENIRHQMLETARDEVRTLEAKWHDDLDRERAAFLDEIRARATGEILAIVRRALADLASSDLQQSAVDAFIRRLESVDSKTLTGEVVLRSPGALSEDTRQRIETTLRQRTGDGVQVRFENAPLMSWGIELRTNGHRIGWNPESYVASLEQNLRHALETR
jgi:F-type H+-transporting ATPase subunit b